MAPQSWRQQLEQRIAELEHQLQDVRSAANTTHEALGNTSYVTQHYGERVERLEAWATREIQTPYRPRHAPYIGPLLRRYRQQQHQRRLQNVARTSAREGDAANTPAANANGVATAHHSGVQLNGQTNREQQQQPQHSSPNGQNAGSTLCMCAVCVRQRVAGEVLSDQARGSGQRQQHQQQEAVVSADPRYDPCGCHNENCDVCTESRRLNRIRERHGLPFGPRQVSERSHRPRGPLTPAVSAAVAMSSRNASGQNVNGAGVDAAAVDNNNNNGNNNDQPEEGDGTADPWAQLPFRLFWTEECVVCLDTAPRCYGPCGHVSLCVTCAGGLVVNNSRREPVGCPVCRRSAGYFKIVGVGN
ncbi:hypothetical protein niasHT_013667 [Heterodera trifolii]|uniref:RING-type domain-containing protein n=1 Tax=Heterodera trifolii TaxID=157864 RepID=A0ABD2LGM5_9BILA